MNKSRKISTLVTAAIVTFFVCGLVITCCTTKETSKKAVAKAEPAAPAFTPAKVDAPTTITFPASDGVTISADLYMAYPDSAPLILLCHRANWSRGEYLEIAPKLNLQGFNAIAIDQRSGKTKNNIDNATKASAVAAGKPTEFVNAEVDIQSAIDYVKANYAKGTFLLWGSSYSSSLGIVLVKANPGKIDAYLAFSPGEYFTDQGKESNWIATEAAGVTIPVFFTSKNSEQNDVRAIFDQIPGTNKTYYCPSGESKHGSEALYESNDVSYYAWKAVNQFLAPFAVKR